MPIEIENVIGDEARLRKIAAAEIPAELRGDIAIHYLVEELRRHAEALYGEVDRVNSAPSSTAEIDGMLALDAIAARYLRRIGTAGSDTADALTESGRRRWLAFTGKQSSFDNAQPSDLYAKWIGSEPPIIRMLADVLWRDVVSQRWQRDPYPSLARGVWTHMETTLLEPGRTPRQDPNGQLQLLGPHGHPIADIMRPDRPVLLRSDIAACLARTGSLITIRLIQFLIAESYRLKSVGADLYDKIFIPGGYDELAIRLGYSSSSHKTAGDLCSIVEGIESIWREWPNGIKGRLFTVNYHRAAPRCPAAVTITLLDPLLPMFVSKMRRATRSEQRAGALVPLPNSLPRFIGSARTHERQARLCLSVLIELREHVSELHDIGAVQITERRWKEMGKNVQLERPSVTSVRENFIRDGFLKQSGTDRYTLGAREGGALRTMLEVVEEPKKWKR